MTVEPTGGPGTEDDRQALRRLLFWFACWGLLGFGFLIFSIWVDWS